MQSPWMNTNEVAEYLRCQHRDGTLSLKLAREWIAKRYGRLGKDVRKRGRSVLVSREAIDRVLLEDTVCPGGPF